MTGYETDDGIKEFDICRCPILHLPENVKLFLKFSLTLIKTLVVKNDPRIDGRFSCRL
jgi:hypothetical protein